MIPEFPGERDLESFVSHAIKGATTMRKHFGLPFFGSCAVLVAGTVLSSSSWALAQGSVSFAEPSSRASFLLAGESYSSSSSSFGRTGAFREAAGPEAPEPSGDSGLAGIMRPTGAAPTSSIRPFSAVAVALKVGSGGIGFDVATPLARHFNLRSGASFFSYNTTLTEDGLNITGAIKFQNASASLDYYPFHGGFRISPGITFRNNNAMNAAINVPGGQSFSLGDGDYISDPADPIHGTAAFAFGTSNFAPRLTMGFGNMLPRNGSRFSFPVEVGFEYIAQPTVHLSFAGTACGTQVQPDGSTDAGCGSVDPSDVAQEQADLQSDLSALRFYPIVSFGVSMRLGHIRQNQ
jgi:hypothetical protein